jgi:hypothetical protein
MENFTFPHGRWNEQFFIREKNEQGCIPENARYNIYCLASYNIHNQKEEKNSSKRKETIPFGSCEMEPRIASTSECNGEGKTRIPSQKKKL